MEIWPIIRLRENSYTRVHFNLTRRILSARIQDPATAPAAVRIPAPAPGRQAAAQDRPATPAVPDSPGPPGVAPARHARPDSPLAREAPEQAEDHAPEAGPTGRARREAGAATPRAGGISANRPPRKKTPKAKLKWKAPSALCWRAPCSRCACPTGTKCWPTFPARCASASSKSLWATRCAWKCPPTT